MKFYDARIPQALAIKLAELGMPIHKEQREDLPPKKGSFSWRYNVRYAEVVDFFIGKGYDIAVMRRGDKFYGFLTSDRYEYSIPSNFNKEDTSWVDAMNQVIEKAIEEYGNKSGR